MLLSKLKKIPQMSSKCSVFIVVLLTFSGFYILAQESVRQPSEGNDGETRVLMEKPLGVRNEVKNFTNVTSRGVGINIESARKDALVNAVRQAVGAYVDQETLIKNEAVIEEKILSVSSGMVDRYDEVRTPKVRAVGLWEVEIKAVVKKTEIGASLRSIGVMRVQDDGRQSWARQVTTLQNRDDAMALIRKVFPDLLPNLIQGRILQKMDVENPTSGNISKIIDIEYKINNLWWNTEAYPSLNAAFSALQLGAEVTTEEVIHVSQSRFPESQFRMLSFEVKNQVDKYPVDLFRSQNQIGSAWLRKRFYLPKNLHQKVSEFLASGSVDNCLVYRQFSRGRYGAKIPVFSSVHFLGADDQEIHQLLVVPDLGVLESHWPEYGGCIFKFYDPRQDNSRILINPTQRAGFSVSPKMIGGPNLRIIGPFFIGGDGNGSDGVYITDKIIMRLNVEMPESVTANVRSIELRSASFGVQNK